MLVWFFLPAFSYVSGIIECSDEDALIRQPESEVKFNAWSSMRALLLLTACQVASPFLPFLCKFLVFPSTEQGFTP